MPSSWQCVPHHLSFDPIKWIIVRSRNKTPGLSCLLCKEGSWEPRWQVLYYRIIHRLPWQEPKRKVTYRWETDPRVCCLEFHIDWLQLSLLLQAEHKDRHRRGPRVHMWYQWLLRLKNCRTHVRNDIISRWFLTGWELNSFYLVHFQGDWEQGAMPPESVHVDIGWLSARKNTADTDACVSEKSCHSQWMEGSDPSPFYCVGNTMRVCKATRGSLSLPWCAHLEDRKMRTVTVIWTPFFHQVNSSFNIIEDDHLAMKYTQEHNIPYETCSATQSHLLELRNTYHIASTIPQFYPLDFLEEYIEGGL